jgi:glycosyltransferase involved in cell wall biosynthesis
METYARYLIPALPIARPDLELVAFVNRETFASLPRELEESTFCVVPVRAPGRSRLRRTLVEQTALPRLARARGVDLLHSLGSTAPARPGVPSIVTVQDVIYALHPTAHTRLMRIGLSVLVPMGARRADRVITISDSSAGEISEVLGIPRERIDVTHLAGRPVGPATAERELRQRFDLQDAPVVLSVSARRPHKNLPSLLRAFARLRSRSVLVLPGYATPFENELTALASEVGIANRVRFLGWVSDADLEGLYAAATCFVFPSLAEGFGLPIVEAMERALPVACSNVSSLPEVAADAVRYFDPLDVDDIAAAMDELLTDPSQAERFARAGLERAKAFSWQRTAEATLQTYDRVIRGNERPR